MPTATVPNKDVRALLERRLRPDFEVVHDNAGHFEVVDKKGERVRDESGLPVKIPGTPHGGRALKNLETDLEAAGVFRDDGIEPVKVRLTPAQKRAAKARAEQARATVAERERNRQAQMQPLRERYETLFKPMGGIGRNRADLVHLIVKRSRAAGITSPRLDQPLTPDLVNSMLGTFLSGGWVMPQYQQALTLIVDEIGEAKDPIEGWFAAVREIRDLPETVVEEIALVDSEWPFSVERLPLEAILADESYQRPVGWPFVREKAASFDASLIGAIDVSARRRSGFAVMDGRHRVEICRLVGLETIWAAVYRGLDVAAEARFFLHKNRDRKTMHPYYTFTARITAQDPEAIDIERIVSKHGYKLSIMAARVGHEANISAIAAVEAVHRLSNETRPECLTDTLRIMRASTYGLEQGNNGLLIRGIGNALHVQPEIDVERLRGVVVSSMPTLWIARARDRAKSGSSVGHYLSRVLQEEYNKGLPRAEQLTVKVAA